MQKAKQTDRMSPTTLVDITKQVDQKEDQNSDILEDDIILFSKRVLFTFSSPFLSSRFDVSEYDKVCMLHCTFVGPCK